MLHIITYLATKTGGKMPFVVLTDADNANEAKSLAGAIVKFHGKANPQFSLDGYFKPFVVEAPEVEDLPEEDVIDFRWLEKYEPTQDKKGFTLRTAQQQKTPPVERVYLAKDLDRHTVVAAAWLFGRDSRQMTEEQFKAATALVMDDAQRYPQNAIMALSVINVSDCAFHEAAVITIAAMKAIWPPFDKAPELGKLSQFATEYLNARVEDRQPVISKWQTGGAKPVEKKEETTSSTATVIAAIGDATLQTNTALSIMGVHPSQAKARDVTNAKAIEDARDPAWRAWYNTYRVIPGIQQVDADTRHAIISEGLKNLKLLTDNEGRLHFVKSRLAGHPACPDLADYTQPTSADDGIDADSAQQNSADVQKTVIDAHQSPSFEGKKEEVDAIENLEPATRSAWLRREILTALDGKTSVMSVEDVKELMVKVGDLNHVYLARLLVKEIEPCDPFKQLAANEVHHLTCDVLENWANGKEERCKVINERVEYYLGEKLRESNAASSTDSPSLKKVGKGIYDVSTLFTESPLASVVVDNGAAANDVREFLETPIVESGQNDEPAIADTQPVEPEVTDLPPYFEPGRYTNISNADYHAANGISSTMLKDARVSLMYFNARHVAKTIKKERSKVLDLGNLVHTLALEPEKLEQEFSIEPIIPKGAFTTTASMREFIDKHNASLPKMTDADTLRSILDAHNATLPTPYALGGNADEIGQFYTLLPTEFQRIGEDQKPTATAMKACIKEYNATLPTPLKTSGSREALLEQLEIIDPAFVELERAIPSPLAVSGSKEDMAARIKTVLPTAVFADELIEQWRDTDDDRILVTQQQMQEAKAIQHALFNHPSAGPMLQHPQRTVEASYFGYDEDTGMEIRVRPDLEIDLDGVRVGFDLKTISMWNVKQGAVRARLHREIIERDYHLSAAMYSDAAAFDQFFWIFVNKDEGYNWVAIVEASADLLELGRLEYKEALRDIKHAHDTNTWPAPITEEIVDDLNDFDRRRLDALRAA